MIDYNSIKDKKIALVIYNSEKENDANVYPGKIIKNKNGFFFINEIKKWKVSLAREKLEKLTKIPEDIKEILLEADYYFTFSMSTTRENNSNEDYLLTGMKWQINTRRFSKNLFVFSDLSAEFELSDKRFIKGR